VRRKTKVTETVTPRQKLPRRAKIDNVQFYKYSSSDECGTDIDSVHDSDHDSSEYRNSDLSEHCDSEDDR
jgi:hypothetical protein